MNFNMSENYSAAEALAEKNRPVFDSSATTDVGKVRDHNEDVAVTFEHQSELSGRGIDGLYIVADGMGGHEAGEVASALSAASILQQCKDGGFPGQAKVFSQLSLDDKRKWVSEVVSAANQEIFKKKNEKNNNMGTTTVMGIRFGDEVAVANVGDSRAYVISGDGKTITQITKDHSYVQKLIDDGKVAEEDRKTNSQRNVVLKSMGQSSGVEPDVFFYKIPEDGSMLLCSDGLWEMVEDEQIKQIIASSRSAGEAGTLLVNAANAAGGEDNISAIVVRNTGRAAERSADAKTEKEWKETMQDMLQNPIAETAYRRTGSLTAAVVAYENRNIINRMTEAQYLALVNRVLQATKTS